MSDDIDGTDLFCGAGGSTSGALMVPGVKVRIAANHWPLAIATHNTNHPNTDHDCADISQVDPRRYPKTKFLWGSPECTNHAAANGKKKPSSQSEFDFGDRPLPTEAEERSRATMWDIPRFAEYHRYEAIVTENVVDARKWVGFRGWIVTMTDLGYEHEIVWLNSMHAHALGAPTPQSRDRMYVVFWRCGNRRPDLDKWTRPWAWCAAHGRVQTMRVFKGAAAGKKYGAQYTLRCPHVECRGRQLLPDLVGADSIIDWELRGTRIGDREKPLSVKTMERARLGVERYWGPLVLEAAGNSYDSASGKSGSYLRAWPAADPLRTLHTTASKALLVPVEGRAGERVYPIEGPLRTQSTRNELGIVVPLRNHNAPKPTTEPLDTIAANGNHHALIMRNNEGGAEMTTPAYEPLRTLTTAGHQSLLRAEPPTIRLEDCEFRMLEPDEIKRGMAFDRDYVILGNKREQVKQAGNAVTPPAARDLIAAVVESLGQEVAA